MNYQAQLERLEMIKAQALKMERETIAFYQQWHSGFLKAMRGEVEAKARRHTVAYIEGLEDGVKFMQVNQASNGEMNLN